MIIRHLPLISMIIFAGMALLVIRHAPTRQKHKTLSKHIAQTPRAVWLARATVIPAVVGIVVWYFGWFVPSYDPRSWVTTVVIVTGLLSVAAVVFAYGRSRVTDGIHDITAWGYAMVLPCLVVALGLTLSGTGRVALLVLAAMQVALIGIYLGLPRTRTAMLLAQQLYIFLGGLAFILASYL